MKNLKTIRVLAIVVGLSTIAWQIMQISNDNMRNMFLIADIGIGLLLALTALVSNKKTAALLMLIMFSAIGGVFSVATFGDLTLGQYKFGSFTTTVGIVISLISIIILYRQLNNE